MINDDAVGSESKATSVDNALDTDYQAVVIIHGIGNQRPMDTLRSFVDTLLDADEDVDAEPQYYSKPDNISDSFELRRLQSKSSRPRTDFFELYWQHLMPSATWHRIVSWLTLLLSRRLRDIPPGLRSLWTASWILLVLIGCFLVYAAMIWLTPGIWPEYQWLNQLKQLPMGIAIILSLLQFIILNYVGDAAIYLSPDPRNIEARHAIREAGITLLKRLHDEGRHGKAYDRIVIVGHSLGSVIGYDILTYAWTEYNEAHTRPASPSHDAFSDVVATTRKLHDLPASDNSQGLSKLRDHWLNDSRKLWLEQRSNGFPWLVSDFVTLGSPLAHSMLLLSRSSDEFKRKKSQFELPTCPPQLERGKSLHFNSNYTLDDDRKRSIRCLHQAACFAVTRWTNLYFPVRYLFKGDLIGGEIAPVLGPGILDVPVTTTIRSGWLTHTCYWQRHDADKSVSNNAVKKLRRAVDLYRKTF